MPQLIDTNDRDRDIADESAVGLAVVRWLPAVALLALAGVGWLIWR